MSDIIYITGHKNPDTDSICAAVAYAELKRKLGVEALPVRLGDISRETSFVLEYFNVPVPDYLATVRTQVSDLNIDVINPTWPEISVKTAWTIMKKNNTKTMPVVDENERLLGVVTLTDITNKYMDIIENKIIATSNTPLQNIVETLNARLLCGSQEDFYTTGRIVVPVMTPDEMGPFIDKGDIVLVGNRKENQIKAIELGVNCIIVTYDGPVENEVIELAKTNGCIVMVTPADTFTAVRLVNQSIPIGHVMSSENIVSFNINDFIDDIKDKMLQTRYRSYPVVDDSNRIKGFISRYHLISHKRKKIILVDHNERSQTIDGIDQAQILEIIDHHRIADIQTGYPVFFKNEPVGSASTIIAGMYFDNGIRPSRSVAGILLAAIISDTMKFKSPTSTYTDVMTAEKLADIAEIHINVFSSEMFKRGSTLVGRDLNEIIYNDFKEFHLGKYKVGVGQINTSDRESLIQIKEDLVRYMEEVCNAGGFNLLLLMVTDMVSEGSEMLFVGKERGKIAQAFHVSTGENSVYLKGVVSRKMQVIPHLSSVMQ